MTGTEFADFLRDTSMLCRVSMQSDVPLLLTFAALTAAFAGRQTVETHVLAVFLRQAAVRYDVPSELVRAGVRAWTDRFGETGEHNGSADRCSVSQGRG